MAVALDVVCHKLTGEEIMEKHLTILGILNIVMGALGLFAACIVLILVGGGSLVASEASGESGLLALGLGIAVLIGMLIAAVSLPALIAGIGLVRLSSWGHTMGLVASFLNLLNIPFGTAVGIYGIWVLFQDETKPLFIRRQAIVPSPPGAPPGP